MNHAYPVLYSFRRCPYAIRARMALVNSGIKVELREVLLSDKPEAMLEASTKGTVPVLVLDNSRVIDESLDIMLWALNQNDPQHWLTESKQQQLLTKSLIHENDFEFKTHLDHYKYSDRFPEYSTEEYRSQGERFLRKLERQFNNRPFLLGHHATLVDYAIIPFIRQFAHVDKPWFDQAPYPKLQQWLRFFLQSPTFHTTMRKYTVWKIANKPVIFP